MPDKNRRLMKINRIISNKKNVALIVIAIDVLSFLLINFIINSFAGITSSVGGKGSLEDALTVLNILPNMNMIVHSKFVRSVYTVLFLFIAVLDVAFVYQIKFAYSEEEINIGQKGTQRWTKLEEIKEQYIEIEDRKIEYDGPPGFPICEHRNKIYIDTSPVNNVVIGTTRSGKGETLVYKSIDVYSRSKQKPSIVAIDMKIELYKSSKKTLERRGYEVYLLNLQDPLHSMGYDVLDLIKQFYKAGNPAEAELQAQAFTYLVFDPENQTGNERYFARTAATITACLIIAITEDALKEDRIINKKRKAAYKKKTEAFKKLPDEEKQNVRNEYQNYKTDVFLNYDVHYIPDEVEYYDTDVNEKKVNMYSIINTFTELQRNVVDPDHYTTMLEVFFTKRPPLDRAKLKYASLEFAGSKTKGNVYSTMLSKLDIFTFENIAKMTAENSIHFVDIGFGDKPIAVFIGFPDYDSSKNFLAVTFIKQVYVALAQKCGKKGKCTRRVKCVVDEAGNLPKIEDLKQMVTIGLGRNIFFDFYIQSLQQFESVYGKDGEIIYGNCGNKVYLMAGDDDTPEKFSKQIGAETVTDLQRTGSMFSLSKHFMESSLEKRLINANQLQELREGEAVIKRIMKRTDNHGNPIIQTPIFNSLDTGTAFKYRYQYLADDFPNADEIDLDDVNTESREYINLKNRVWDPEISFRQMTQEQEELSENGNRLKDFPEDVRDAVLRIMEKIKGDDYNMDEVLDMDITAIKSIINADNYLKDYEKKAITITINSVGGGKKCEDSVKKEN